MGSIDEKNPETSVITQLISTYYESFPHLKSNQNLHYKVVLTYAGLTVVEKHQSKDTGSQLRHPAGSSPTWLRGGNHSIPINLWMTAGTLVPGDYIYDVESFASCLTH